MSATKGKFMDALQGLDSEPDSDPDSEQKTEGPTKKPKAEVTFDQLQKCGFKGGPSVLYVKPPKEDSEYDLQWSNGRDAKGQADEEETYEEREQNRKAVTEDLDASAEFSQKAVAQAAKLAQAKREEKAQKFAEKNLTFGQKEKRKRDAGQQSRGKNFVEEEKRMARGFGMYSGFD